MPVNPPCEYKLLSLDETSERNIASPITWVIDNIINERQDYHTGFPTLAEAAREAGHRVIETKYVPFRDTRDLVSNTELNRVLFTNDEKMRLDGAVLLHGSHEFIRSARNTKHLKDRCPLSYCREDNLRFSTYAAHYGEWMLNDHFIILPYAEVIRRYSDTRHDYFVRPNDVTKEFTGRVINHRDFAHEINSLNKLERVNPESLIVLARPRQLLGEFRFVIADGEVITGSEYRWDNRLDIRIDVDANCQALAEKVANHIWQPDRVYVCDIALEAPCGDTPFSPAKAKIVELNSFSCAGLYACDTTKIVKAVSRTANKEYYGVD